MGGCSAGSCASSGNEIRVTGTGTSFGTVPPLEWVRLGAGLPMAPAIM